VPFHGKQTELVVGYSSIRSGPGGSSEAVAVIYDEKGEARLALIGHTDSITNAVFNSDASKVITTSERELRIWDAATGIAKTPIAQAAVKTVTHPTDPERFMILTRSGLILLYDIKIGEDSVATIPSMSNPAIFVYDMTGNQIIVGNEGDLMAYDSIDGVKSTSVPQAYQLPGVGSARINGNVVELLFEGTVTQIGYFGGRNWKDYVTIANGFYVAAAGADELNRFELIPSDGGRIRNATREDLVLRKRPELVTLK
jgi:WD40 repeat protein